MCHSTHFHQHYTRCQWIFHNPLYFSLVENEGHCLLSENCALSQPLDYTSFNTLDYSLWTGVLAPKSPLSQSTKWLVHFLSPWSLTFLAIHNVLTGLWMTKWIKTIDNPLSCSTEHLLVLITQDKDGGYLESENDGYLAKFGHCICLTCLKKLKVCAVADFKNDENLACDALQPWFTKRTNLLHTWHPKSISGPLGSSPLIIKQSLVLACIISITWPSDISSVSPFPLYLWLWYILVLF